MLTIGIIDRHPVVQLGLKLTLATDFDNPTVYAANSFSEFRALKKEHLPTLFILGFQLGDAQQYTSKVKKCRSFYPSVPLIIYGDYLTFETICQLFNLGVKGYILKKNEGTDLIYCVNAVIKGSHFINANLESKPEPKAQVFAHRVLTKKQFAVASLLIQGISNAGICERLNLKASTISTFKNLIFKKLNVTNVIQLKEIMYSDL